MNFFVDLAGCEAATGKTWRIRAHWWDAGSIAAELAARFQQGADFRSCSLDVDMARAYAERFRERAFNRHMERVFELDEALDAAGPEIRVYLRQVAG
ncbi:MAG: hypothetical protein KF778_06035 [Rhodocyclaceae bacterium]|nr:hypothetical protein [Rhodocyclaceae bacterium]